MDDELYMRLAAAIERYLAILADHGLILDAECGAFINEPVYGAYEFLIRGMQVIDPFYPRVECLRSTLGPDETHDRLEHQLVEFAGVLNALCAHCEESNGIDPIQDVSDPVTSRIGLALLSVDIAAERLRAEGATHGDAVTERARSVLADLTAEDNAEAIDRHRLTRRTSRA